MLRFLSLPMLVGAIGAVIPLLVHLSRSRRVKKMRFSSTRFFTEQFVRSRRMSKLKEVLLLLMRMALCALFAVALARPVFMPAGGTFRAGKRLVVLVLDNSASMGYAEGGTTPLDRARGAAHRILEQLRPGDTAALVLAARRATGPEAVFPEPTPDLDRVREAVDGVTALPLGTDLAAAVTRAELLARGGAASSKEIYVLSDLQDAGWEVRDEPAGARDNADLFYFFVQTRPEAVDNFSLAAVQYANTLPLAGVPYAIQPLLRYQGGRRRSCEVALFVDNEKVGQRAVDQPGPGGRSRPIFHHTFTAPGWHSGYVELPEDRLAADNRRYFAFQVAPSLRVLAVDGAPSRVRRLDELFFLRHALSAGSGGAAIQVDVVAPSDLRDKALEPYPLVILANVASLTEEAVGKLEAFADRGGSVFFFLGDRVQAPFYNQRLTGEARLHGGLLPARLKTVAGDPHGPESYAFVSDVDFEHSALTAFQNPRFADLSSVTFKALWQVEPAGGVVLMRTDGGLPVLIEKPFGKGRTMLFAGTADRDWTNFQVRPAFLPWVQRLAAYLAQGEAAARNFYATGDRVPVPVAAAQGLPQVRVRRPDGRIGGAVPGSDAGTPLAIEDTLMPGVYAVYTEGSAPGQERLFAANVENYESDLRYLDDVLAGREGASRWATRAARVEAGLKELLPGRSLVTYVPDPARAAEAGLEARQGMKLWDAILLFVLALAFVEVWLANRIFLKHYAPVGTAIGEGARE